jgi:hypothetical protein
MTPARCHLCNADRCHISDLLQSRRESVTVDDAIAILNHALYLDFDAFQNLVERRVACNADLADHPTIQVATTPERDRFAVGLLGVLNGLFGVDANGDGPITGVYSEDNELLRFDRTDRVAHLVTAQDPA